MNLVIHDLEQKELEHFYQVKPEDYVISKEHEIHSCMGCFGCWLKTPGRCVIKDQFQQMGERFAEADQIVLISRCTYGGYSPFVKGVLERSISFILPYFTIRKGEVHHALRYRKHPIIHTIFYGDKITADERETAELLVKANGLNLGTKQTSVKFCTREGANL